MKKLLLSMSFLVCTFNIFADEFPIDLEKTVPLCEKYKITDMSTRLEVMKFCTIIDTHSGMVRIFRGTQKVDISTTNMGNITCKFNRSLVNTDGALKECWTTTPPAKESAVVTVKSN